MLRQFSAGGAVFKKIEGRFLWLLIKPKPSKELHDDNSWRLPKGLLEEGEKSVEAAAREVKEETGVKAKIIQKIEANSWFFTLNGERIFKTATYFLMEALEETDQSNKVEIEEVGWFSLAEAEQKMTLKKERATLEKAEEILVKGQPQASLFASK